MIEKTNSLFEAALVVCAAGTTLNGAGSVDGFIAAAVDGIDY